jgi:hypothetical protein
MFGLEAWVRALRFDPDAWRVDLATWQHLGARIAMLYPAYDPPGLDALINVLQRLG